VSWDIYGGGTKWNYLLNDVERKQISKQTDCYCPLRMERKYTAIVNENGNGNDNTRQNDIKTITKIFKTKTKTDIVYDFSHFE